MVKPKSNQSPDLTTADEPKVRRPKKLTNEGVVALSKQLAARKSRNIRKSTKTKETTQVSPQKKRNIQDSESIQATRREDSSGEPLSKCRKLLFSAEENKENFLNSPKHKDAETSKNNNNTFRKSESYSCVRSFSPKPSTSTDLQTIQENEQRFNESLENKFENSSKYEADCRDGNISPSIDNIVIDLDEETQFKTPLTKTTTFMPNFRNNSDCIILDESITDNSDKDKKCIDRITSHNDIDIIEIPCETITIEDYPNSSTPRSVPNINRNLRSCSPIVVDDYDSCMDITPIQEVNDDDIVDLDALRASNETFLEKYKNEDNNVNTVTYVEANSNLIEESIQPQAKKNTNAINRLRLHVSTQETEEPSMRSPLQTENVLSVAGLTNNFFGLSHENPGPSNSNNNSTGTNENINRSQTMESDNVRTESSNDLIDRIQENDSIVEISQTSHNNSSVAEIVNDFFNNDNNRPNSQLQQNIPSNNNNNSVVQINDSIVTPEISRPLDYSIMEILSNTISRRRPNRRQRFYDQSLRVFQEAERVLQLRTHNRPLRQNSQNIAQVNPPIRANVPVPSSSSTISSRLSQPSPPRNSGGIGECPICMESMSGTPIASTLCGHVFCLICIQTSISTNGKKCPTCRKALKGIGYHQLFL